MPTRHELVLQFMLAFCSSSRSFDVAPEMVYHYANIMTDEYLSNS